MMSGDHNAHQNDFHPDWDTVKAFDDRYNEDTGLLRQCLEALEQDNPAGRSATINALKERLK
jgi:hypothetical protein